jgi:predicted nucleic acid-binding protein
MPEVISNTSPLQYLYQLDLLDLLPALYGEVLAPIGVVKEIAAGRTLGVALPDIGALPWLRVCEVATPALLSLIPDLGLGEREVLALALERPGALVILDDSLARRLAERLELALTGTLGLLLKAKQTGRIERVRPYLAQLESLNFRLDDRSRLNILKLAGE